MTFSTCAVCALEESPTIDGTQNPTAWAHDFVLRSWPFYQREIFHIFLQSAFNTINFAHLLLTAFVSIALVLLLAFPYHDNRIPIFRLFCHCCARSSCCRGDWRNGYAGGFVWYQPENTSENKHSAVKMRRSHEFRMEMDLVASNIQMRNWHSTSSMSSIHTGITWFDPFSYPFNCNVISLLSLKLTLSDSIQHTDMENGGNVTILPSKGSPIDHMAGRCILLLVFLVVRRQSWHSVEAKGNAEHIDRNDYKAAGGARNTCRWILSVSNVFACSN